jgi:hypothetical protein
VGVRSTDDDDDDDDDYDTESPPSVCFVRLDANQHDAIDGVIVVVVIVISIPMACFESHMPPNTGQSSGSNHIHNNCNPSFVHSRSSNHLVHTNEFISTTQVLLPCIKNTNRTSQNCTMQDANDDDHDRGGES